MVNLIYTANKHKWTLEKNVGIVSYNETPLKSIIVEGIATITSDFAQMGRDIAKMISKNKRDKV